MQLVAARFIPSAVMLLLILPFFKNRNQAPGFWRLLSNKDRRLALLCAFLAVPGYHICLNYGETLIPAGWASLVIALNPACIAFFAAWLLRESVGLQRWAGVGIALAGLFFIGLTGDALSESGTAIPSGTKLLGLFITLGAVISWGGFSVLSKRLTAGRNPLEGLTWFIGLGSAMTVPWVAGDFIRRLFGAPLELWGAVLFLSLGCTVIGFAVWLWVLSKWQASLAGSFIYLAPLTALFFGKVYLGEPLSVNILIGAAGVLGGVIMAGLSRSKMNGGLPAD